MVTARLVDKEFHGVFAVMLILVTILSMISKGGFYLALVRRKENSSKQIGFAFWISVAIGFLFSAVIFFLAEPICAFYNDVFPLGTVKLMSFYFVFYSLGLVSMALMIKDMEFKKIFIAQCGSYLIGSLGVGIYMAHQGFQLWSLVYGFLSFILLNSVFNFLLKPHSIRFNFGKNEFLESYSFSIGISITELLNSAASYIDKLIIGKFSSMSVLAIFEKGQQTSRLPIKIYGSVFDNIIYTSFSKLQDDEEAKRKVYLRASSLVWIVVAFLCSFVFVYAKHIVIILLGINWLESIPILKVFALAMPLFLLSKINDGLFRAEDKLYKASVIKLLYLIMVIASAYSSSWLSLLETSILLSLSYGIYVIVFIIVTCKELGISIVKYLTEMVPAIKLGILFLAINLGMALLFSDHTGRLVMMVLCCLVQFFCVLLILNFLPRIFGIANLKAFSSFCKSIPIIQKMLPISILKSISQYDN